jgi:hypothetical protein
MIAGFIPKAVTKVMATDTPVGVKNSKLSSVCPPPAAAAKPVSSLI